MRRAIVATCMTWAAVLAPTAAAQVPTQDSVTGSITYGEGRSTLGFTLSASSGPGGEDPTGTVTIHTFVAGDLGTFAVSCLGVSGNHATIVAPFPGTTPPTPAGVVIQVEDNGSTGDKVDSTFVSTLPDSCPPPVTVREDPFTSGNVTVVDAPSFPTLREQCKNSGWRTFGVFENQGSCVRFVATGGKNPSAAP